MRYRDEPDDRRGSYHGCKVSSGISRWPGRLPLAPGKRIRRERVRFRPVEEHRAGPLRPGIGGTPRLASLSRPTFSRMKSAATTIVRPATQDEHRGRLLPRSDEFRHTGPGHDLEPNPLALRDPRLLLTRLYELDERVRRPDRKPRRYSRRFGNRRSARARSRSSPVKTRRHRRRGDREIGAVSPALGVSRPWFLREADDLVACSEGCVLIDDRGEPVGIRVRRKSRTSLGKALL